MEVVSGDNWSYTTFEAPVKSSPPTNQRPAFYGPDGLPVAKPMESWVLKAKNIKMKWQ